LIPPPDIGENRRPTTTLYHTLTHSQPRSEDICGLGLVRMDTRRLYARISPWLRWNSIPSASSFLILAVWVRDSRRESRATPTGDAWFSKHIRSASYRSKRHLHSLTGHSYRWFGGFLGGLTGFAGKIEGHCLLLGDLGTEIILGQFVYLRVFE